MSDSVKSNLGQLVSDIGEAAVKPVVDEVGKAIETATAPLVGQSPKPQSPADVQKKQQEEQKRKNYAIRVIEWNKKLQENQAKVRQQREQQLQARQQEEQRKSQVRQFELVEKEKKDQHLTATQLAARKTELKGGVGG